MTITLQTHVSSVDKSFQYWSVLPAMVYPVAMPIYEYKCLACGHLFEKLVKLDEKPNCPACDSADLEKQFTMAAVSTTRSRSRNFQKARARAKEVKKEKDHAQAEYERNYIKDHS